MPFLLGEGKVSDTFFGGDYDTDVKFFWRRGNSDWIEVFASGEEPSGVA